MTAYFDQLDDPRLLHMGSTAHCSSQMLLILVASDSQHQLPALIACLEQAGVAAMGGVFYKVIFDTSVRTRGCVVTALKTCHPPHVISRQYAGAPPSVEHLPHPDDLEPNTTALVFVDTSAPRVNEFLTAVYGRYRDRVRYLGGGSGLVTGNGAPSPWSFATGYPLLSQCATIGFCEQPASISGNHGLRRVYGPILATRVEGDVILELNWQPAMDVYQAVVEAELGRSIPRDSWHLLDTRGFPFGMVKEDAEDLVRLPVSVTDEGGLVCIGGIHNNCVLHILRGDNARLVAAARQAATDCTGAMDVAASKIVLDCVSRYMFMNTAFDDEITAVVTEMQALGPAPVIGALCEGEVASLGMSFLDMLNTTIVIGAFAA